MATYIDTVRAISSIIARRVIITAGIVAGVVACVLLLIIWSLAFYVSAWWWLLLLMYLPLLIVSIVLLSIVLWIQRRIYTKKLSSEQRSELKKFSDKLTRLVEARGLGWWMFALASIRELVQYRELRTLKTIINDSSTIKSDFEYLKQLL